MKLGSRAAGIGLLGAAAVATVIACSGSTSTGGSGTHFPFSGPTCSSGTFADSCWSCAEANCAPACITNDCSEYFTCFCACAQGDTTCYSGCSAKVSPACNTCNQSVSACLYQSCQSACGLSSSSGSGSSSGASGSSSGGGGTVSTYCDVTTSGVHECFGYQNLSPTQATQVEQSCTGASLMGHITTGCATSGQVGCCTITQSGYRVQACYYCGDPSTYASACTGQSGAVWTAGTGGPTNCD